MIPYISYVLKVELYKIYKDKKKTVIMIDVKPPELNTLRTQIFKTWVKNNLNMCYNAVHFIFSINQLIYLPPALCVSLKRKKSQSFKVFERNRLVYLLVQIRYS